MSLLRGCLATVGVALVFVASSAVAGGMCNSDKTGTEKLEVATTRASAKFYEATSVAFLAFKAVEDRAPDILTNRIEVTIKLLDEVKELYGEALKMTEDLSRADEGIRKRPLEDMLKRQPTEIQARWLEILRQVRQQRPATELISVCANRAQDLKPVMSGLKVGMPASGLRRAQNAWLSVLSSGALVSDAFDSSVR